MMCHVLGIGDIKRAITLKVFAIVQLCIFGELKTQTILVKNDTGF